MSSTHRSCCCGGLGACCERTSINAAWNWAGSTTFNYDGSSALPFPFNHLLLEMPIFTATAAGVPRSQVIVDGAPDQIVPPFNPGYEGSLATVYSACRQFQGPITLNLAPLEPKINGVFKKLGRYQNAAWPQFDPDFNPHCGFAIRINPGQFPLSQLISNFDTSDATPGFYVARVGKATFTRWNQWYATCSKVVSLGFVDFWVQPIYANEPIVVNPNDLLQGSGPIYWEAGVTLGLQALISTPAYSQHAAGVTGTEVFSPDIPALTASVITPATSSCPFSNSWTTGPVRGSVRFTDNAFLNPIDTAWQQPNGFSLVSTAFLQGQVGSRIWQRAYTYIPTPGVQTPPVSVQALSFPFYQVLGSNPGASPVFTAG